MPNSQKPDSTQESDSKDSSPTAALQAGLDYVDLWKYFESRGAEVKNTMLTVVTWIIGFAALIAGFTVQKCLALEPNTIRISHPFPLIFLSLVGLVVTVYAEFLIRDFGDHINRNFNRADRARNGSGSLEDILNIREPKEDLPGICKRIRWITWVFGGAFALGILLGLQSLVCGSISP